MSISIVPKNKTALLLAVIFIIESLAIARADSTLANDAVKSILHFADVLSAFAVLFMCLKSNRLNKINYSILGAVVTWWIIQAFDTYSGEISLYLLPLLCMSLLSLTTDVERRLAFEYYRVFLVVTSALGIVAFVSFMFNLPLPSDVVSFYGEYDDVTYIDYRFSYLAVHITEGVRLCGLFNEPGYLGTFIGMFLFADSFNIKKKSNIILIIAGCLTFSVGFFVTVVLGLLLLSYKNLKVIIPLVTIAIVFFYVLPNVDLGDGALNTFFERFRIEDGHVVADNRSGGFDDYFARAMSKPDHWFWGYGTGALQGRFNSSATYKFYIYQYGFLGALLMWGTLFRAGYKMCKKNFKAIIYLFLFIANIYQRPHIFTFSYFLLLFGGIGYLLMAPDINECQDSVNK